ncbi:MAG: heavy-metal-associated domain-containing protein [Bdellovibrionota bacterium]
MKKVIVWMVLFYFPATVFAEKYSLEIEGMVCDFCAQGITKKLNKEFKDQDIKDVHVDLNSKRVTFDSKKVDEKKLRELIKASGYNLKSVDVQQEVTGTK